ncbi:MAG: hypothetical protein M3Z96_00490 [Pseudomonadota bacterium]|nr:hypothetical protein [Pseudomonadota bacterium]MDQ6867242.1 hypothetical protein [Pseudomonadota bacterium]
MIAYIAELNRLIAAQTPPPQPLSLRQRFLNWHRSLPEFARNRRFAMSEFEAALKTQGKHISPVLLELGWQRKRIWSTTGQYHRYWVPPPRSEEYRHNKGHA